MNKFAEIWMIATMAIAVLGLMVLGWVLAPYCMIIEDAAKKREDRKGGKR